jgi:hypothetical protein
MFIEWQTNKQELSKRFHISKRFQAFKALLFLHERFPIPA